MDSNIGKKLDGRYEITELIGVGGMADVYKAQDIMEDRPVAVKILKPEFSGDEEFLRRFRNESKAIAVLSHPNIVKIYDVGFTDEIQFIVMEYIDGITLKEFIEQQGVLKWKDALHFITQILRALQHAHDKGIVHRDIKPQNIMLFTDGTIKVMDFGIARFSRIDGKTLSDKAIGSVHYISPEQAQGEMTDERSDIYSVGVMLYEMLTGRKPFDGDTAVNVALKHMQEVAVPPREIMPSIPEALEEIVYHAMEKQPAQRYQSAAEMIRDIDTFKLNQSVVFGYKDGSAPVVDNVGFYPVNNNQSRKPVINDDYDDYDDDYEDDYDDDDYDDDDDDDDESGKKRSYVVPILLAVTVAVVIVAAIIIGWTVIKAFSPKDGSGFGIHTSTITVPNLVGENIIKVEGDFKDKLKIETIEEYNFEYEKDTIFWQSISPQKSVKEGTTITLKVSKGKQMIVIPDVSGSETEIAESELRAAGFTVVLRSKYDDKVPDGIAIGTEPVAGTEFASDGAVTLYVSKGPLDTQVKVPNVVGLTKEKAIAILKDSKLKANVQDMPHDGDKGKVIDQSIEADRRVERDSEITIYVSTGETDPVDLTISIPMPEGMHGVYSIVGYVNGNPRYTQNIANGESVAGGNITMDISGKKTETITVSIQNQETGKSVNYAVFNVNYDKKTAELNGSLDKEGLLKITPTVKEEPSKPDESSSQADPEPSQPVDPEPPVSDDSSQADVPPVDNGGENRF